MWPFSKKEEEKPKVVENTTSESINEAIATHDVVAVLGKTKSNPTLKDVQILSNKIHTIDKYLKRVAKGEFAHKDQDKINAKIKELNKDKKRMQATIQYYKVLTEGDD